MKKLAVVMMLCAALSMAGVSGCASGNGNTAEPSADSATPEPAGKEAEQDSETTPIGAEQENKSAQEQEPGQKDVTDQGSSSSGKEGAAADGKADVYKRQISMCPISNSTDWTISSRCLPTHPQPGYSGGQCQIPSTMRL